MKILRKKLKSISFIMSFLILFASCTQYDDSLKSESKEITTKNSGEDIFKGLFFFQNENYNKKIEFFKDIKSNYIKNDAESNDYLIEISDISIKYINENNPYFFDQLKSVVYSKNLYEIENILSQSAILIEKSLLNSEKYSKIMLASSEIKHNKDIMQKLENLNPEDEKDMIEIQNIFKDYLGVNPEESSKWLFYAVAAAVSIAAVVYSVVNWVVYWDILKQTDMKSKNSLIKEKFIVDISDYFSNI